MPTETATLLRWAMQCAAKADDPATKPDERQRLLRMREALLELAKAQDWLDGKKTPAAQQPKMPPTQQQQQRQPRKPGRKIARKVTGLGPARRSPTAREPKRLPG